MRKNVILMFSFLFFAFTACNDDDDNTSTTSNSVAFSVPSLNLTETATPVQIVFEERTSASGTVTLTYAANQVAYGTDFTTTPAAEGNKIVVPFTANASSVTFTFNKITNAASTEVKNVVFTITDITLNAAISSSNAIQVNFNEAASLGAAPAPEVGGPMQPNSVFVDLSSGAMVAVPRTSWDLGFYSGTDFRVAINSSVKMSAKQLATTNIDEVQAEDPTMIIGNTTGVASQIDSPIGNISGTAIAEVSDVVSNNKVYLINMGSNPAATAPAVGADGSASGTSRGWKKVRILKSGSDYKIQYADIAATTHQEMIVTKSTAHNFTFLNLTTNSVVVVEPQKNQWDLNFTTFTNLVGPTTPYFYADYILTNLKGGAKSYMVPITGTVTYDSFDLASVVDANFAADQRNIGSSWRSTSVPGPDGNPVSQFVLNTARFFVVKDPAGNVYKLRLTGGTNTTGERGFPKFQYAKL